MATFLHDVPHNASMAMSVVPQVATADVTGNIVDMNATDGPAFVVVATGAIAEGTTVSATVFESNNQSAWTEIDTTFSSSIVANTTEIVSVNRTKRYLRVDAVVDGSEASAAISIIVGAQKKVV